MESRNELKETDIKNRTCYSFDDILKARDIDSSYILSDKKTWNILIYDISHNTFMGTKPLRIMFNEIDAFIKIHDGIKYLVLLGHSWYDKIWDRIKYLISKKSGITDSINYNFVRIRIDLYNSLPIEQIFTFYNVIILIN